MSLLMVNVRLALRSLGRNRLRTFLTMLGMIFGVAAVLTMVALGTGARASVEDEVRGAGANLIFVSAGNYTRGGEGVGLASGLGSARTLRPDDAIAIGREVAGIRYMSPGVAVRTFVSNGAQQAFVRVHGVGADFGPLYSWTWASGAGFTAQDVTAAARVIVIGRALATRLFASDNAVGREVHVRDASYRIVGVAISDADDQAGEAFVPWTTLQQSMKIAHLQTITLAAERAGESSRVAADVTTLLRMRHSIGARATGVSGPTAGGAGAASAAVSTTAPPDLAGTQAGYLAAQGGSGGTPDDFTVRTQAAQALTKGLYTPAAAFALANLPQLDQVTLEEMADTLDDASDTMTALLASIAAVSLIVGGIGIMNIMLVSVTERTREIGLRMATGARGGDVGAQFLVEAVTLSLIGGAIGLALGLISSRVVGWMLAWPSHVSAGAIVMAFGIAAAVGLIFGSYPARRAARLDPIDALRTE
jgi:putative ABC transport system permease protein